MKLLILEDCPLVGQQLAQLVRGCGHDAVTRDAGEALDVASDIRPDLLIADVDLGSGGDGIEAAVLIHQVTSARVVFVTGCNDRLTRNRAQAVWPLGFVTKPFDPKKVSTALAAAASVLLCSHSRRYLLGATSPLSST